MVSTEKINGYRINSYSDIRRDVAITSSLTELQTNLGNLSFVERTSSFSLLKKKTKSVAKFFAKECTVEICPPELAQS